MTAPLSQQQCYCFSVCRAMIGQTDLRGGASGTASSPSEVWLYPDENCWTCLVCLVLGFQCTTSTVVGLTVHLHVLTSDGWRPDQTATSHVSFGWREAELTRYGGVGMGGIKDRRTEICRWGIVHLEESEISVPSKVNVSWDEKHFRSTSSNH